MAAPSFDVAAPGMRVAPPARLPAHNGVYQALAVVVLFLAPWCMLLKRTGVGIARGKRRWNEFRGGGIENHRKGHLISTRGISR